MAAADRIVATDAALAELRRLQAEHGPLLLFQSGGCCDGSLPICLNEGDLVLGPHDVLLGEVGGCPVYIDSEQDERWHRPTLVLDVSPGRPEGFSLGGAESHFVTHTGQLTQWTAAARRPRPSPEAWAGSEKCEGAHGRHTRAAADQAPQPLCR